MQHSCSHSNAICNHSFKKRIELRRQKHTQSSFKAQLQCGKKKTTNRPQPQPPHRRGTFHRRLQPLYTEKHKVSCSGFLSTTLPMQHSCSHSNAICNHGFKKRIELRRQKHTQSSFKAQLHCGKKKTTNRPQPQPPHRRGTFHRRLQPLYTEKHKVSCSGFLSTTLPMQHSCSHSNAICNHSFKKRIELRRQKHTQSSFKAQLHCGKKKTTNRPQPQPPHRRGTFHRRLQPLYTEKHKVSCSGFLSATLPMQHSCSHSNAICNHSFKKRIELRRQKHTQSSFKAQLHCGKKKTTNRPQPQPPHRRGSFHRRLQPLYTEKHKVSCSGFLSATLPMQHSCSHSNAICNHSFKKRIELRRQKHTQSSFKAQLQCGKKKTTNRPQPQPSHRRGSFHRRLQPLYTEKHKVSCSGFLSTTLPMQHSCSHSNAICNHSFKKRIELRRQKHTQSSFKAQLQCGKKKTTNRPQPQPSHRRGSFHRRLQPLYTEKHKVSCSGFLSATLPMQHSCSHSNAICNHSFKKRIELRRQKHTQSSFKAQLQCGKKKTTNRPQPQPSHRRGSFHRRLQPLYTEKHKVSCSGFLPTT